VGAVAARVVCVSHSTGSYGAQVAAVVASRLGYRYLDEEIVVWAAGKEGLEPDDVADAERLKSFWRRLFSDVPPHVVVDAGAGYGALVGAEAARLPPLEAYRQLIRDVIADTAEQGEVVIVAHAASMALAGRPSVLRVLVTASTDVRIARQQGDAKAARRTIAESDAGRADYLKRFYGIDRELPSHYDLVINTDTLSTEQAASIVEQAARAI
jgi:Cytidylate kinase-like family